MDGREHTPTGQAITTLGFSSMYAMLDVRDEGVARAGRGLTLVALAAGVLSSPVWYLATIGRP